jgi:hypothetical protein
MEVAIFKEEAEWVSRKIREISRSRQIHRVLNIGSSTLDFQNSDQPHISTYLLSSLHQSGIDICNVDLKSGSGVEIVGDLLNPEIQEKIKQLGFEIVLCTNVLEHVPDLASFAAALEKLVPANGWLIVSVPKIYPYHNDPIDNMYRPSCKDLLSLFPSLIHQDSLEVYSHYTYFSFLIERRAQALRLLVRLALPFYKSSSWLHVVRGLTLLPRRFVVSCVVFKKA